MKTTEIKRAQGRAHYEKNRAAIRERQIGYRLKTRYGITREEYDLILVRQGGVCRICRLPSRDGKRLHVDHDHKTGVVRGILCFSCNQKLGWYERFRDQVQDYLS